MHPRHLGWRCTSTPATPAGVVRLSKARRQAARIRTPPAAELAFVVAATTGVHRPGAAFATVGQIADAFTPCLGHAMGTVLSWLGMLGAALIGAIVSSIAGEWDLAEVFGWA